MADHIIGTPQDDIEHWDGQQSHPDTCAIRCQEFIIEQFTGQEHDEDALVNECMENGWYSPGSGTSPDDVGNLLEAHGIAVNRVHDATAYDLAAELGQGHKVIVGVDAEELWENGDPFAELLSDLMGVDGTNHAVVVSGIDTSIPGEPMVIISDPGTGQEAARYPMSKFLDAVEGLDGDFFMVSTVDPGPAHLAEMSGFDYTQGHIDHVTGLSWEQFEQVGNLEGGKELYSSYLHEADETGLMEDIMETGGSIIDCMADFHGPIGMAVKGVLAAVDVGGNILNSITADDGLGAAHAPIDSDAEVLLPDMGMEDVSLDLSDDLL